MSWESASSCYAYVAHEIGKALVLAVAGDLAAAKKSLTAARTTVKQAKSKAVMKECDDQLKNPADESYWGAPVARHAGFG